MWLINFIEKHKKALIICLMIYMTILFLLNQILSKSPMALDVVIYIFLFGCFGGSLHYLLLKAPGGGILHAIVLSHIFTALGLIISLYQLITHFSLDVPTEIFFIIPGLVFIPNSIIYKTANRVKGTLIRS